MAERPRTLCPGCNRAVEPDDGRVVEAVEIVPTPGFGAPSDVAEGMQALFHEACFDEHDARYRRM